MNSQLLKANKSQLERLKARLEVLNQQHNGKENEFTYWVGFHMGYVKGQISILEDWVDGLEDE